jgi:hypothetical protein
VRAPSWSHAPRAAHRRWACSTPLHAGGATPPPPMTDLTANNASRVHPRGGGAIPATCSAVAPVRSAWRSSATDPTRIFSYTRVVPTCYYGEVVTVSCYCCCASIQSLCNNAPEDRRDNTAAASPAKVAAQQQHGKHERCSKRCKGLLSPRAHQQQPRNAARSAPAAPNNNVIFASHSRRRLRALSTGNSMNSSPLAAAAMSRRSRVGRRGLGREGGG